MVRNKVAIIIGAGPAGLTAAYCLLKFSDNILPVIIDENDEVGGLSRTISINGLNTDIGSHRFFTKNANVYGFWRQFLQEQGYPAADDIYLKRDFKINSNAGNPEKIDNVFLKRKRFSRIFFSRHFIDYPIKLNFNTFFSMGIKKTIMAAFSYIKSCVIKKREENLEDFMINRFGRVLYQSFFEGYTEKVWGKHPSEISKEWGIQRIKGVSLFKAVLDALFASLKISHKKEISLIDEYFYPKLGSSQLWNTIASEIEKMGGNIILNSKVVSLYKQDNVIKSVKIVNKNSNEEKSIDASVFVSSMPIKDLFMNMNDVPESIRTISDNLQYRDFILVNFLCSEIKLKNNTNYPTIKNILPDSWIYLQDSDIKAGRLNVVNQFSPYIIRDYKNDFVINLEYFCSENDDFWNKSDIEIEQFAKNELKKLNIADEENIKNTKCFRFIKAYPCYFGSYENFDKIKDYVNSVENLYCIGRNGQHKYNNMDHSVLSGITLSEVIINNLNKNILWDINTEKNYQETK